MKQRSIRIIRLLAMAALAGGWDGVRALGEEAQGESAAQALMFLPTEFYARHRAELGLKEEQMREMERIRDGMRAAAEKPEGERTRRTKELQEVMSRNPVDAEKAMESFQAVLSAEDELKALRFRAGIATRNALSTEQWAKVQPLAKKESAQQPATGVRAAFSERLQQLRVEIHRRTGAEPGPELVQRIKQIEQSAKEGRLGEAKDQLEQVLRKLREVSGAATPTIVPDVNP